MTYLFYENLSQLSDRYSGPWYQVGERMLEKEGWRKNDVESKFDLVPVGDPGVERFREGSRKLEKVTGR